MANKESIDVGMAATAPGGALRERGAPGGGAAAPLDLSQGHFGTRKEGAKALPPVVKRSDLYDWISDEEIAGEVWAAFRGAVRWADEDDFEDQARDLGLSLREGTIVKAEDGKPWCDRGAFLDNLCEFIYWRLSALAEERGVFGDTNPALPMGREGLSIREAIAGHAWGKFVRGKLVVHQFKTKREAEAFARRAKRGGA